MRTSVGGSIGWVGVYILWLTSLCEPSWCNGGVSEPAATRDRTSAGLPARGGVDVRGAVLMALLGLLLIELDLVGIWSDAWGMPGGVSRWWHAAPLLVLCVLMALRRRIPLLAMGFGVLVFAAEAVWGGSVGSLIVLIELVYAGALHGRPAAVRVLEPLVGALVVIAGLTTLVLTRDVRAAVLVALQVFAVFGTSFWWGASSRRHVDLAEAERQRAEAQRQRAEAQRQRAEAERERAQSLTRVAELRESAAVRDERRRMAADLHDALSGNLAAITIHAEAALAADGGQGSVQHQALTVIRETSRHSLAELQTMILLLRPDAGDAATAPGLDGVGALVEQARRQGLAVDADLDLPVELPGETPPGVAQAAYRIVQEALHNAAQHMPGGSVDVALRPVGDRLDLVVSSHPGPSVDPSLTGSVGSSSQGAGLGLRTMRERAEALGGQLSAGREDERWVVRAHLPLTRSTAGHDALDPAAASEGGAR
ncbi:two-component sensor histidine kinase [Arsenicicoccus piscis]|uniref:histidine kinase n=1 Tax=Arsenicicoccus piscis TaxID=673954 RepID=A0ABQ6HUE1_9MICO|nr:two-component sensor histidine kinase [Arsenicicoccus piscis]